VQHNEIGNRKNGERVGKMGFLCCWSRTETHLTNEVALGSALVVSVDRSLRSANLNFWHVNV
jgi:hypothetical protein